MKVSCTNRALFLLVTVVSMVVLSPETATSDEQNRPNVVVIMADDMGYSDIGSYGGEIDTPHLDTLGKKGVRFTQFYNAARCSPTRGSLLTGVYPHEAGVGRLVYRDMGKGYRGHLKNNTVTVGEILQENGYFTAMTGKWHVGHQNKNLWPSRRGFDRFYGIHKHVNSYWTVLNGEPVYRDGKKVIGPTKNPPNRLHPDETFYTTDVFTDWAIKYVKQGAEREKPMFLYVAYNAPHWPLQAPEETIEKYEGEYMEGWESLRRHKLKRMKEMGLLPDSTGLAPSPAPDWDSLSEKKQRDLDFRRAIYAAQIDRMDQNIGRLVESLRAQDMLENTLLLFLSDNGSSAEPGDSMFGWSYPENDKSNFDQWRKAGDRSSSQGKAWAIASNAPFRKYKRWTHEGGIRTPLIAHWPEGFESDGELIRQPGHVIDLMPTVLDVADASYPDSYPGRSDLLDPRGASLIPMIRSELGSSVESPVQQRTLFWEHNEHAALRQGPWKLVNGHVSRTDERWVQYDFDQPRTVNGVSVFWFSDREEGGGCDVPADWRVRYRADGQWKTVSGASQYGVSEDQFNRVTFDEVTTTKLRLEVAFRDGWSAGIHEWCIGVPDGSGGTEWGAPDAKPSASHVYEDDTAQALNDGYVPETSGAKDRDKHTWWPRKGSGSTPWGSWTLYRMDRDPSELNDLSEKHPGRVERMKQRWYELAKETNVIPWPK